MKWYYVDAGQQAGPVEDAQLAELVRTGKIQPDTLVWHEGMGAWAPYQQAVPAAPPPAPPPPAAPGAPPPPAAAPGPADAGPADAGAPPTIGAPGGTAGVVCSECGRVFPASEVIRYGDRWVCASCKPTFLQRLREGAALGPAGARLMVSEADLLARDYEVDIGDCLTRAWELFKPNAGILIGASLLVWLAFLAANGIPYLSAILALLLNGPLMGGLWLFYLKKVRNQDATVGDAFGGFGPRFWQLVLAQLIPSLIAGAFVFVLALIAVPAVMLSARHSGGGSASLSPGVIALLAVLGLVALCVITFLNVCWIFGVPLVADKGLNFWPALELSRRMVKKHWWMTFLLLTVSGFLGMAGFLACCFGLLVSGPVAFAMIAYHYEKVFGDLAPNS